MEYLYKMGLEYAAPLLILAFLSITFLQSGYDKVVDWKGNLLFLTEHFKETFIKKSVPFFLSLIMVFEIIVGLLSLIGIIVIYVNQNAFLGYIACILAAKVLLLLFFGQRIAKDYEGAKTIAVYFIVSIIGIILLK
jgi:putative oxidoreductase